MSDDDLDAMLDDDDLLDAAFDEMSDDDNDDNDDDDDDADLAAATGALSLGAKTAAAAAGSTTSAAAISHPGLSAAEMKTLEKYAVSSWGGVISADVRRMAGAEFRAANAVPPSASYLMGGMEQQKNRAENTKNLDVDGLLRAVTADTLALRRSAKSAPLSMRDVDEAVAKLEAGDGGANRKRWVSKVRELVEGELKRRGLPLSP